MSNDLEDFFDIVGTEVPLFRTCDECDDIAIINPKTYDKPKSTCDPSCCPYYVPYCLCYNKSLHSLAALRKCRYPECDHG
jgi:hypothetical protein